MNQPLCYALSLTFSQTDIERESQNKKKTDRQTDSQMKREVQREQGRVKKLRYQRYIQREMKNTVHTYNNAVCLSIIYLSIIFFISLTEF